MKVLYVRLSDDDHAACEKTADLARLPLSAWARHTLVKVAEAAAPKPAKPAPPTIAQKAEARDAVARAKAIAASVARQKTEWVRMCLRDPRQAHLTEAQMHGMMHDTCNSQRPDIRADYEAAMQEAIEEAAAAKEAAADAEIDRLREAQRLGHNTSP